MPKPTFKKIAQVIILLGLLIIFIQAYMQFMPRRAGSDKQAIKPRELVYEPSVYARSHFPQHTQDVHSPIAIGPEERLQYQINSHGYRGPEFSVQKPEGAVRIMVYGGSTVFDAGASNDEDWPRRLERYLRLDGVPNAEVINAGIPGHNATDALGRLLTEGHHFQPDYVILYGSWADIKDFNSDDYLIRRRKPLGLGKEPIPDPTQSGIYPNPVQQYRLSVETFVDVARNIGAQPLLLTQSRLLHAYPPDKQPADFDRRMGFTRYYSMAFGLEGFRIADNILKTVAREKKAPLIDAANIIAERNKKLYIDHIHFTDEGRHQIASLISEVLRELMANEK